MPFFSHVQITADFINVDVEGASLSFGDQPWAGGEWNIGQASAVCDSFQLPAVSAGPIKSHVCFEKPSLQVSIVHEDIGEGMGYYGVT